MVYAVDFATGELRWARELHRAVPPIMRHLKNSFASETPVTDGERLYVYFGSIGLVAALTLEGETRSRTGPRPWSGRTTSAPRS